MFSWLCFNNVYIIAVLTSLTMELSSKCATLAIHVPLRREWTSRSAIFSLSQRPNSSYVQLGLGLKPTSLHFLELLIFGSPITTRGHKVDRHSFIWTPRFWDDDGVDTMPASTHSVGLLYFGMTIFFERGSLQAKLGRPARFIMYYVYILQSLKDNRTYVGCTDNS